MPAEAIRRDYIKVVRLTMFGNKLSAKAKGVTYAATTVAVFTLLNKFVGVFRDRLLSGTFGAGEELDAYYAAFQVPNFMFGLLVAGAISAGFIPVLTSYMVQGDSERMDRAAAAFASRVLSVLGMALVVASVVGAATAHWFVPLFTGGFAEAQRETAILLTRVMFLSPFFLGLSSVFAGILQTYKRFLAYSATPILYNLGIILGTLLLSESLGVLGAAIGVGIGAFLHMSLNLVAVLRIGFRFQPVLDLRDRGIREIARMMVPRTASLALEQANFIVITAIAASIGVGSVSAFNLALNLQYFPVGILGLSFAVASFPFIAELAEKQDRTAIVAELSRIVRLIAFLMVPATVAFVLLRAQIVRVVLGSGAFDWGDTVATADMLSLFSISMLAQALIPLLIKVFFAHHDVRTPLLIVFLGLGLERVAAWLLVGAGAGAPALALAYSVGCILRLMLLWWLLKRLLGNMDTWRVARSVGIMALAALPMALVLQATKTALGGVVRMDTFAGVFSQGALAGLAGLATYMMMALLLGSPEAKATLALARARFASSVRRP
ncbi:murein biosynthesis integral membrane protein MurJ [Patescibacteria group bacterium]